MRDLIDFVARSIVEDAGAVEVSEPEEGLLELRVADADLGRMIGRRGRTAQAMRALLRAAAPGGAEVELEILGQEESVAE